MPNDLICSQSYSQCSPVQKLWEQIKSLGIQYKKPLIIVGTISTLYFGWGIIKVILGWLIFGAVGIGAVLFAWRRYKVAQLRRNWVEAVKILKSGPVAEAIAEQIGSTSRYVIANLPEFKSVKITFGRNNGPLMIRPSFFFTFSIAYMTNISLITIALPLFVDKTEVYSIRTDTINGMDMSLGATKEIWNRDNPVEIREKETQSLIEDAEIVSDNNSKVQEAEIVSENSTKNSTKDA